VYRGELTEEGLQHGLRDRLGKLQTEPKKLIGILDACTDDYGARANFGKGNQKGSENLAYD
jgi:hypothetical protein